MILEKMKQDIINAKKAGNFKLAQDISCIIGESQRQKTKLSTDEDIYNVIRKMKKDAEKSAIEINENTTSLTNINNEWISLLVSYLPKYATSEEVIEYINKNFNIKELSVQQRMPLIQKIKKHFDNNVDAIMLKQLLIEM